LTGECREAIFTGGSSGADDACRLGRSRKRGDAPPRLLQARPPIRGDMMT
jgi:hypothetical protein